MELPLSHPDLTKRCSQPLAGVQPRFTLSKHVYCSSRSLPPAVADLALVRRFGPMTVNDNLPTSAPLFTHTRRRLLLICCPFVVVAFVACGWSVGGLRGAEPPAVCGLLFQRSDK
jgi:hypothetical protein